ncbi:MAG: hypothetical protein M3468_02570, partial [Acidobacteriota bacterium]|nr:hypothetical protein [Acidobacteriota bacterium]
MKFLVSLVLIVALAAGGAYIYAGRLPGPTIELIRPEKFVGLATPAEIIVAAPGAQLKTLTLTLEQNGKQFPLYTLGQEGATVKEEQKDGATVLRVTRDVGKQSVPELVTGPARILVTASHPVLRGIRVAETTVIKDVQVRLERPRVSVISTHHFINHGGGEVVVYRATPDDIVSGVIVGDTE